MRQHFSVVLVLIALLAVSCAPLPVTGPAAASATPVLPPSPTPAALPPAATSTTEIPTTAPAPPSATTVPTTAPAPPTAPTATTAPATPATIYTSAALGISFSYLPDQNGQAVKVLEQGDKIYVYPANMEPTAGQWVQAFPKPAGESLEDAIKRIIMPGHPAQDCQVVTGVNPTGAAARPSNYVYAGITVRRAAGEDEAAVLPRWKTCPQPYTVVGGIGYFQADTLHPEKFLFFSIGQYFILAGDELPWQATIKFD